MLPYLKKAKPLWWLLLIAFMLWFFVPRLYIAIYNEPFRVDYSPDKRYRLEHYDTLFTPPFSFTWYEHSDGFNFMYRRKILMSECCRPGYIKLVRNQDNRSMGGFYYGDYYRDLSIRWYDDSVSIVGFLYRWENLP